MRKVKVIMIAEVSIPACEDDVVDDELEFRLDAFREAVRPSAEHGISLYQATRDDLEEFASAEALLPHPGVLDAD